MKKFEELNDLIDHYKTIDCKIVFQSLNTIILDDKDSLVKIDFVGSIDGYIVTDHKTFILNSLSDKHG